MVRFACFRLGIAPLKISLRENCSLNGAPGNHPRKFPRFSGIPIPELLKSLSAYLGLTPSERSTGERVKRGGITMAGNTRARRLLIEAAWSYRFPPRVSQDIQTRIGAAPHTAREIAWKAQMRLCGRFRCSATIWMGTQRQSGWPFRRSRREYDCRGATITQAIFA